MRFLEVLSLGGVLALSLSCSQTVETPKRDNPGPGAAVSAVGDAKTILISKNSADQTQCAAEVVASGGKIIYQGPQGLILTEKQREDLKLKECKAEVAVNPKDAPPPPRQIPDRKNDTDMLQRLLPKDEIAAKQFISEHPTFDGRGVTIAVLDTGMEINHPMLQKTSTGEDKIVDFQDFTGVGLVKLTDVKVEKESFLDQKQTYSLKGIKGKNFRFGTFAASTLTYNQNFEKNTFPDVGVLAYQNDQNTWVARIDSDNNKDFSNDVELGSFKTSRKFTTLGKEKTVVVAVTFDKEGKTLSFAMADEGHATHVAGIAAGNDPKSLVGIAPGAKILAARLADGRFQGGPTTTASMLLAIDFAVENKADIINMSYGSLSAFKNGEMAIEQYVNKIALEKNMIFAISAGNEGPALYTIGSPAGANLAISVGAYLSTEMAREMYGSFGMPTHGLYNFSSIGPRLDGGWRPSIVAPGGAFSSYPHWGGDFTRAHGTSMAAPQVAGGLALLLSAAKQEKLLTDRPSISHALIYSAKPVAGLNLMEQGHGLVNLPAAYDLLKKLKTPAIGYALSVTPSSLPGQRGQGILIRSGGIPNTPFSVQVNALPNSPTGVRNLRLKPSVPWIKTPDTFAIESHPNSFQVFLESCPDSLKPGMRTEKISAIDESTGLIAFEVPVTLTAPEKITYGSFAKTVSLAPGATQRFFFNLANPSSVQINLGKVMEAPVRVKLTDPDGLAVTLMVDPDPTFPQEALSETAQLKKTGTYELDLFGSLYSTVPANAELRLSFYGFRVNQRINTPTDASFEVVNLLDTAKVTPKVEIVGAYKQTGLVADGKSSVRYEFELSKEDLETLSKVSFQLATPKGILNQMTDYGYQIWGADGKLAVRLTPLSSNQTMNLDKLPEKPGKLSLEIYAAFTKEVPKKWGISCTEMRIHKNKRTVYEGKRTPLTPNQSIEFDLSWGDLKDYTKPAGFIPLPLLTLGGLNGEKLYESYLTR